MSWQKYQEDVADLFQSFGFVVKIEAQVAGARGVHTIDVYATRSTYGVETTWIAECKLWNRAVPKEKVLVLSQIATDVGADRAFLFSESGFQSGALGVVENTNVTLTSLSGLRSSAQAELNKMALSEISTRAYQLQKKLQRAFVPAKTNVDGEKLISLLGQVFELKTIALPKAQAGEFPVYIDGIACHDASAFIIEASAQLDRLVNGFVELTRLNDDSQRAVVSFDRAVHEFLDAAEEALFHESASDQDRLYVLAFAPMRRIGDIADQLRVSLVGDAYAALASTMQALIDGPYLLLADQQPDKVRWVESLTLVKQCLDTLNSFVRKQS